MKIGYVGLGALGSELARRFIPAHEVRVWDVNGAAVQRLANEGARPATSAADLARECDVVLTCLPRSADVHQLLFGLGGLAEGLRPGTLLIDQTSGTPTDTRAMAQALAASGVAMIDAPVSASPQVVPQGAAVLMVAGPDDAVERALPVLRAITDTIYRCGTRVGDGQAMKMLNNAMNSGVRLGTLEIAALGRKAGLTLPCMTAVLNLGAAANLTTERMLPNIAAGKESTNFALALMVKDLNQAAELGLATQAAMPLTGVVRALLQIGLNTLGDQARLEQMIGVIESMAGTRLRREGEQATVVLPEAGAARDDEVLVWRDADEPTAAVASDRIVLDLTSRSPDEVARDAERLAAAGAWLVDASACTGADGTALAVFVSGDSTACARVAHRLRALSPTIVHCGVAGGSRIARALHAGSSAVNRAITLECVVVGRRYGLPLHDMAQVLVRTSGWSGAGRELLPALAAEPARPTAAHAPLLADLRLALRLGQRHGAPLLLASAAAAAMELAS